MNTINILFTLGNILLFIASFPTLKQIIKNRDSLGGFSITGSLITYIALVIFMSNYISMNNWSSVIFSFPTVIMWGTVIFYLFCNKIREGKK
jgi:hypothetical protein